MKCPDCGETHMVLIDKKKLDELISLVFEKCASWGFDTDECFAYLATMTKLMESSLVKQEDIQ